MSKQNFAAFADEYARHIPPKADDRDPYVGPRQMWAKANSEVMASHLMVRNILGTISVFALAATVAYPMWSFASHLVVPSLKAWPSVGPLFYVAGGGGGAATGAAALVYHLNALVDACDGLLQTSTEIGVEGTGYRSPYPKAPDNKAVHRRAIALLDKELARN